MPSPRPEPPRPGAGPKGEVPRRPSARSSTGRRDLSRRSPVPAPRVEMDRPPGLY